MGTMRENTWETEAARLADAFEEAHSNILEAMGHVTPDSDNADALLGSLANVMKATDALSRLLGSAPAHADAQTVYVTAGDVLDTCGTLRYLVLSKCSDDTRNAIVPALEHLGDIVLEIQETTYGSLARC